MRDQRGPLTKRMQRPFGLFRPSGALILANLAALALPAALVCAPPPAQRAILLDAQGQLVDWRPADDTD
jgi:hypothetical protein